METTHRQAGDLSLNTEIVKKVLVDFVRDETHNAGFSKGVLGLSGGVDSAVVAFIAAEALGRENVTAVLMPYRTSEATSISDAERVADAAAICKEVVDISPMVDPLIERGKITDKVRAGNIMARQRMIVLYDVSSRDRSLVLGTSNKTELLLGYGTIYGDMASAINPLGDLYKSQVWQLAGALGVPRHIIEKKPSADLWPGQTDEGEMGFTYEQVDRLLYFMIDERRTDVEMVGMGFDLAFVHRVRKMIASSQFKRRPPLIAKISNRTINIDFRYARDWGI